MEGKGTRKLARGKKVERGEKGRKDRDMEERVKKMEKIMEREEKEKKKKNIIIKGVSEKEDTVEDVRRIRKKIGVEIGIEEVRKIRTGREEKRKDGDREVKVREE